MGTNDWVAPPGVSAARTCGCLETGMIYGLPTIDVTHCREGHGRDDPESEYDAAVVALLEAIATSVREIEDCYKDFECSHEPEIARLNAAAERVKTLRSGTKDAR